MFGGSEFGKGRALSVETARFGSGVAKAANALVGCQRRREGKGL